MPRHQRRKDDPGFSEEDVQKAVDFASVLIRNKTVRTVVAAAVLVSGMLLGLWYLLGYPSKVDEAKASIEHIEERQDRIDLRLTKVEKLGLQIKTLQEDANDLAEALPRLKRFIQSTFEDALAVEQKRGRRTDAERAARAKPR